MNSKTILCGRRALLGWALIGAWAGASQGGVVGWRTDWTGRYPDADPPLQWSSNQNVKWSVALSNWANATPILVGNKLIITAEPLTLMCLDAETGRTLWQATNHAYADVYSPEESAKMKADEEACRVAVASNAFLVAQMRRAVTELQMLPDDPEWVAYSNAWMQKIEAFKPTLTSAQAAVRSYAPPARHGVTGWATPTPVSDGKYVWMLFGNGVVVCYDLDGNRKWGCVTQRQKDGQGQDNSPALVGDALVIYINDLFALDKNTGRQLWLVPCPYTHIFGSVAPARLGGEEVVVAPGGEVVRAGDGKLLAKVAGVQFNTPVVEADTVYFIDGTTWALKFAEKIENDAVTSTQLWKVATAGGRHYGSGVHLDGIVYDISEGGVLSAVDAQTGKLLYGTNLNLKVANQGGTVYPSVVAAGKAVLVSSDNGMTVVVQPGPAFNELARNVLEPFRSTPVAAGKRLYIRTMKSVYCIGQ